MLHRFIIRFFITYFLCSAAKLVSQDSLQTIRFNANFFFFDLNTRSNTQKIDTSFNQLPNYFQRNLMGSVGLPDYGFLLSYQESEPLGIKWFSSPYDKRILGIQHNDYYWQKGIYTSVFGAAGSKKEQVMKLTHTQNINDKLNFSLKLNRYGATGFYQYQQSFVNNVLLSSNYINKKNRFGYFGSVSYDRFKHQENGGITSDTSIVKDNFTNKALLPVRLEQAKRNYSLLAGNFSLFTKLNRDSVAAINHFLVLGVRASVNKSQYTDSPLAGYYPEILKDSTGTHDSTSFYKLSPVLSYNLNTKRSNFELGIKYDWSHWLTPDTGHYYNSLIAQQGFAWISNNNKLIIKQRGSYIFQGNNNSDFALAIQATYTINFLRSNFSLKSSLENRSPDLFFNYTSYNNYYWKNNFDKTQSAKVEAKLNSEKLHLEIGAVYNNTSKMLVLAANALPVQLNETIHSAKLFAQHHLKVYKFHLQNIINYQTCNSYALVLPALYTQHQFYFEHRVKKNGVEFQIGVQANYISKIDLISYNPSLNSYYLNYSGVSKGNYVFADFFFNVNFKPVKFFFKAEHLNQGFSGTNYTFLNGYYQPDRAFRFGLNWEFWD